MRPPVADRLDQLRRRCRPPRRRPWRGSRVGVERGRERGARPAGPAWPGVNRAMARRPAGPPRPAAAPSTSAASCDQPLPDRLGEHGRRRVGRRRRSPAACGPAAAASWCRAYECVPGAPSPFSSDPRPSVATMAAPHGRARAYVQPSFDELGRTAARRPRSCVVDLETTGGSAAGDAITEIGAVKVRGGEVLGEFQTLVNPGSAIPPFVSVLTGITDSMVRDRAAASTRRCRRSWSSRSGSVLVAHNAPFDVGFLKAACARARHCRGRRSRCVDTAVLARRVLTRDEVPNCKLATLAPFFRATTTPNHRALDRRPRHRRRAARADRAAGQPRRARRCRSCARSPPRSPPPQRRKRHLADGLPHRPGRLRLPRRRRAGRSTSAPAATCAPGCGSTSSPARPRTRMGEMVGLAERVDPIACAHAARGAGARAAADRRAQAALQPPLEVPRALGVAQAHRRGRSRGCRSCARSRDDGAPTSARCASQRQAEAVRDAIHDAVPLRQCSDRLSLRRAVRAACALAGIGRCAAPCEGGAAPAASTPRWSSWSPRRGPATSARWSNRCERKLAALSAEQRYEQAAVVRDRIATVVRACARMQRLRVAAARSTELVAARPDGDGGWELSVVRRGRLAAAGRRAARGRRRRPVIEALLATADVVDDRATPAAGRGDRVHPALARGARHPARATPASRGRCRPSAPAACVSWLAADAAGARPRPVRRPARALPMRRPAGPARRLSGCARDA